MSDNGRVRPDIDSLKRAFWLCARWDMKNGLFIGDSEGWRIIIGRDADGTCAGNAVHAERNVVVNLTPGVVGAWLHVAQTKLRRPVA